MGREQVLVRWFFLLGQVWVDWVRTGDSGGLGYGFAFAASKC